jgi:hypothetical protein
MRTTLERPRSVVCKRLGVARSVDEHLGCAYCHGEAPDVASGDASTFCDFDPTQDPICFGFPTRSSRLDGG